MITDRQEELAALYVFDLLEGAELAEFEADLRQSEPLRSRVKDMREAAASLAHAAPQASPPAALKSRIMASAAPRKEKRSNVISFPSFLPWAAAAGFALVAAWAAQLYVAERSENVTLRGQERMAELALQGAKNQLEADQLLGKRELVDAKQLLADSHVQIADLTQKLKSQGDLDQLKISALASLLGNSPQALAVAVWNPQSQKGVLTVSKLPVAASGKDYQLWVIDPDYPTPVSAGVFAVDSENGETRLDFTADKPVKAVAKFAVSLERKGGAPTPEGAIVMLSK